MGSHDIAAAILSAGQSRRMGSPKALLAAGVGQTFLERIAEVLREAGLRHIVVVVAPESGPIRVVAERANVAWVENPDPSLGPISSIRTALDIVEAEGFGALLFWPVDTPCVAPETVRKITAAYRPDGPSIIIPVHDGRRGHPVIHGRAVWPELRSPEADEGARVLVGKDPGRVCEVPVDDEGVLLDIDTTREYRQLRVRRDSGRRPG
jgi:molybdenum cofactor cytidylyltransferase